MCPVVVNMNSRLSAITFFAKSHPGDVCGSNGLPLTPNSIAILGKSQFLKTIKHPNLCEYLDIIRGKHERTIIVSEYYGIPLSDKLNDQKIHKEQIILKIFYQIACGLDFIYQHNFVCYNLEPDKILIDDLFNIKIFDYGLYYMTNNGSYVSFPIGNIRYMSPERILGSKQNIKSDIWSLGITIIELIFGKKLWISLNISQILRKIISLCNNQNIFEKIAREHECLELYENINPALRHLIEDCLKILPNERPIPSTILLNQLFQSNIKNYQYQNNNAELDTLLMQCNLKQIYYLWQLAGGDIQNELKKAGLIRSEAPILSMPKLVSLNGKSIGPPRSQSYLYDTKIVKLNLTNLTERLSTVSKLSYFPLILTPKFSVNYCSSMENLPLIIREKNTEYQFYRILLFQRLLNGYPFTKELIIREAEKDIPPLLRGHIWACLLGVIENNSYADIDKVTPTTTDRQIEVDIPRCHQYDELLSSPEGHFKLKRLLKAWVTSHPQYVYWQGLDSLTAPFLYLNFNNEERAFLSLYKFIPKYLHWFFLKDNSSIIKEYLSKFSQLTAYHEPILAKHLSNINFIPELFAIPWFLTMFSHVFPLHKIIHLWDKLMLGDHSYPLYIGISVLQQLKNTLLSSGFNECILLFSDLPDIVMETCVIESQKMYLNTPKSITYRKYVLQDKEPEKYDISDVELSDLQKEMCPRISTNDLIILLKTDTVAVIDLRSNLDFNRAHIRGSVNIPFTTVLLGCPELKSLNHPDLDKYLMNRTVVIVGSVHENSILFSKFLVECGVSRVCILHKGFNILHSVVPNILESL